MKRLSVEESFLWAQRFVAAEWRLLVPLALAFLALPPLVLDLVSPKSLIVMMGTPDGSVAPDLAGLARKLPLGLVVLLLGFGGGLSIVALALVPRISVREAIGHGFRRLPTLVGAWLVLFGALLLGAVLVALVLAVMRLGFVTQQAVLTGLLLGTGMFVWVRLAMLAPVLVTRRVGPIAALRLAWEASHGQYWRLFGALALYLVGAFIVILALSSALGAILVLLGRAVGLPDLGALLSLIVLRVIAAFGSAGLQLLAVGFYLQLAPRSGT